MSVFNLGPKTFTAGEALVAYRSVKFVSGEVFYCGADEAGVGATLEGVASGDPVSVFLFNQGGTVKLAAGETVAQGASCYNLAGGKIGDTNPGTGTIRFVALDAATADGDIIEVLPVAFI